MNSQEKDQHKPTVTLTGIVEKVIADGGSEKAQIAIHGGVDLYREIRIDNAFSNGDGTKMKLKPGDKVNVTIEITDGTAS
jgi:hypothetical protein